VRKGTGTVTANFDLSVSEHYQREAIFLLNEALRGIVLNKEDKDQSDLLFESCRTVLHCYLDLATAATATSPTASLVSYNVGQSPLVSSTAGGEWTADLLIIEGLGIIGRLWGERLGSSTMVQVNTCTSVVDPHRFQCGSMLGQMPIRIQGFDDQKLKI
jgi:hypothetical protein